MMKSSDEMVKSLFERREQYITEQNNKRKRAMKITTSLPFQSHRSSFMHKRSRLSVTVACIFCILCLCGCTAFALHKLDLLPTEDIFIIIYEELTADQGNEGLWSETDAFDVSGYFVPDENNSVNSNVNIRKELTLKKGKAKTWDLAIDGGWFGTAQDTVAIEIINNSNLKFQYICEDVTEKKELANFSTEGDLMRILSNLNPKHKYEIIIINLEAAPLTLEIKITSYQSDYGEIVLE